MAKSKHATVELTSAELMQIKSTITEALDALSHWQRVQFAWEALHHERFEATRETNLSPYQLYLERERETSTLPDTPEKSHSAISKIIEIDALLKAKEVALFKSLKSPEKTIEVQPKEKEKERTMGRFTGGMQRFTGELSKEVERAPVSRDPAWEAQLKRAAEIGDQDRIKDAARFPELAAEWDGYLKSHPGIERPPAELVEYATFTAQLGREAKERDAGRPELGSALDEKMAQDALELYRERQSGSFENAYYGLGGDGPNVRSMGEHTVPEGPSVEYHKALGGSEEHEMGL